MWESYWKQLLPLIDAYMVEIFVISGCLVAFVFLVRSFKRNLLISRGQSRFVLEHYDVGTEKLHKLVTFFVIFLLLPLLGYVKFLAQ